MPVGALCPHEPTEETEVEPNLQGAATGVASASKNLRIRVESAVPFVKSTHSRSIRCEDLALLTESEVQRSFSHLFLNADVTEETFDRAETLIDNLRPESPLRLRLSTELDELRSMHAQRQRA